MTRDSDFKRRVRERMRRTGQNYTAARADLVELAGPASEDDPRPPEWEEARREQERVVARFITDGVMTCFPQKRRSRAAVLLHLVSLFEPGRAYPEPTVNAVLEPVHADFAFWRRELVDYGYLERRDGIYRLAPRAPERPAWMAQEIPRWEELWLPLHLRGEASSRT